MTPAYGRRPRHQVSSRERVLRAIREAGSEGWTKSQVGSFLGRGWGRGTPPYPVDSMETVPLVRRGLVEYVSHPGEWANRLRLTAAGRAYLQERDVDRMTRDYATDDGRIE